MTDDEARACAQDGRAKFRVWWTPQIPMEAFFREVGSYAEGVMLCDTLGAYDAFQFEHNVKPDYCNAGGVQWLHPEVTDGDWMDLDQDEAEDLGFAAPSDELTPEKD